MCMHTDRMDLFYEINKWDETTYLFVCALLKKKKSEGYFSFFKADRLTLLTLCSSEQILSSIHIQLEWHKPGVHTWSNF